MGILSKNRTGLEIGQRSLRAATVGKSGIGLLAESILPEGLILNSFTEPNITDIGEFAAAVRTLMGSGGLRGGSVNVALPDYISRVSVVEFDALPGTPDETERMLKWKLKKTLPFDVEQAELRSMYLGRFKAADKDTHRFLVSVIKADVLAQYEQALTIAGLTPKYIETSSFAIWNLFEAQVMREVSSETGFALMNLSGGKLAVMVFSQGVPNFLRLKDLWTPGAEEDGPRVLRELNASLTFYRENFSGVGGGIAGRVFMAGDAQCIGELSMMMPSDAPFRVSVLDVRHALGPGGAGGRSSSELLAFAAACGAASEV